MLDLVDCSGIGDVDTSILRTPSSYPSSSPPPPPKWEEEDGVVWVLSRDKRRWLGINKVYNNNHITNRLKDEVTYFLSSHLQGMVRKSKESSCRSKSCI